MSNEYNAPGGRLRSFGVDILSGNALAGGDMVNKLQDNIQFRIESARGMLMGGDVEQSMSPVERRQQIRERRLNAIRGGDGDSPSTSTPSPGTSSGRIGEAGRSPSGNDATSTKSSTPSMSEVNAGTKKRASEQGYGN